jgi:hypothetical protein
MSKAPGNVYIVPPDEEENRLTTDERLDALETRQIEMFAMIRTIDERLVNLLQGLQKFLEFAEQMKGHPLLSAFGPPGGKQQRKP